jgi:putative AdoMet-dependent methyltransferase
VDRLQLFDAWARDYAPAGDGDDAFPFAGYERVLDGIVRQAEIEPGMMVLDLGIGTGNLAVKFVEAGCRVWGLDFSAAMLEQAREQLPQAQLLQADLLGEWPAELDRRFDRIVSAYVLHEFDLASKVGLLQRLVSNHLATNGWVVIGDIAFSTSEVREQGYARWADRWDEEEHYWAADEAIAACGGAGSKVTYRQVSVCGGVFSIRQAE